MRILVVLSAVASACLASPGFLPGAVGSLPRASLDALGCPGQPCSVAALPYAAAAPAVAYAAAPVALTSQYHAQDELGQYSYGYQGGLSAKSESRAFDGSVAGGYSYVDANGVLQSARYTADPVNGFRVSASNLPADAQRPVQDTPEVAQARAAHAAFVADAAARSAAGAPEARGQSQGAGAGQAPAPANDAAAAAARAPPPTPSSQANIVIGPSGVPLDTPEVAAARAADAVAHLQAKAAFFG